MPGWAGRTKPCPERDRPEQKCGLSDTNATAKVYLAGLRNQHAIGTRAIGTFRNELSRTKDYPELHARMEVDRARSTEQAARLDRILEKHATSASLAKEAVTGAVATAAGFAHAFASDEVIAAAGFKAYGIRAWKALIAMAEAAGARDDIPVLRQSMTEKQEMGDWLPE